MVSGTVPPRHRPEAVGLTSETEAQRYPNPLSRAVHQVAGQLGVRPETLTAWLAVLVRPGVAGSTRWPLLGPLRHSTCGLLLRPARDSRREAAYLCPCTGVLIPTHVAHLHLLAAVGGEVPRLIARRGLTGLAEALGSIRVDDAGAVVSVA